MSKFYLLNTFCFWILEHQGKDQDQQNYVLFHKLESSYWMGDMFLIKIKQNEQRDPTKMINVIKQLQSLDCMNDWKQLGFTLKHIQMCVKTELIDIC